jgi:predicted transposase YbfD/YdcC
VDDKTNEITAVEPLLQHLVLDGRIVTMDALLTQPF